MADQMNGTPERQKRFSSCTFLLCLSGLLINIGFAYLARTLALPLYLDNIGSALAAALGGYVPGIIVGFLTNLINGIWDYSSIYYGSLTILIAMASAWFAGKKYYSFKKPWRLLAVIAVFALIGGGLGSIMTWFLYGFSFASGISAPLALRLFSGGIPNEFLAQLSADLLVDLADKSITVLIVALSFSVLPASLRKRLYFASRHQNPLSRAERDGANKKHARIVSLRLKLITIVIAGVIITGAAVTAISFAHFKASSRQEQENMAWGVASVASDAIDGDRVDEYIRLGEKAEGYSRIAKRFDDLAKSSENIQYVYAYRILENGCQVVFDADTPDVPGGEPGEMVEFDEDFLDKLPDLLAGREIEPVVASGQFGWLLTVYKPVYDSQGVCQCYIGVDISMEHILRNGYQFLARVISLFFVFLLMLLTITILFAEYNIILPINALDDAMDRSGYDTEEERDAAVSRIRDLQIHTGDEIEDLYHSITGTTEAMVQTVQNMEHQSEVINKLQNGLILVLADMVEGRDKCTGDHVKKTAAYVDLIMRELKRENIYTDQLTDEFILDVVHSAPLHDIGKIRISDLILNKPGKLTEEEFETMKTHTTAGAEIIRHAMNMVSESDSGYLREAMNLAQFHHEKWNGTGYPSGLKGEEIPLSARIMAVADVFDALVSRRSYKEPFPFEKAMQIIQKDAGSHFDPAIAGAFCRAGEEVRRIMESVMDS